MHREKGNGMGKPEGKTPLGRPKWEDNIKIILDN
jgi:hypothetical protein